MLNVFLSARLGIFSRDIHSYWCCILCTVPDSSSVLLSRFFRHSGTLLGKWWQSLAFILSPMFFRYLQQTWVRTRNWPWRTHVKSNLKAINNDIRVIILAIHNLYKLCLRMWHERVNMEMKIKYGILFWSRSSYLWENIIALLIINKQGLTSIPRNERSGMYFDEI